MIQFGGTRRHVYIKFREPQKMQETLTASEGQAEFWHENGEISKVCTEAVGLGMKRVRVANLPPEVADGTLKIALETYSDVREIQAET
jgi:hypothetical protein